MTLKRGRKESEKASEKKRVRERKGERRGREGGRKKEQSKKMAYKIRLFLGNEFNSKGFKITTFCCEIFNPCVQFIEASVLSGVLSVYIDPHF